MTIEEVRRICNKIADENGFVIDFPINTNSRLKTTLGRVCYKNTPGFYDLPMVDRMEFSARYLESGSLVSIMDTIRHEMAHAFVLLDTGEVHGHDACWKAWAVKLGATPRAFTTSTETGLENDPDVNYKYTFYCKKCGKLVETKSRACKLTRNYVFCTSKCCHAPVEMRQNW